MHTPYPGPGAHGPGAGERLPLRRPAGRRLLAGVCAGLAEHLGLHPRAIRIGFAVAAALGGVGLVVYGFLWAVVPEEAAPPRRAGASPAPAASPRGIDESALRTLLVGAVLVILGLAFYLQLQGVGLRLGVLIPMLVVGVGAVYVWSQLDRATRNRWVPQEGPERRGAVTRLVVGTGLAVVGLLILATQGAGLAELWDVTVAVLVVLAGVALIGAPWAVRLWNDLRTEQAERIRETERADIAAHLHDSVLQTLALIQRRSIDSGEVSRLARAQERALRAWLYDGPRGSQSTLATAVTRVAHEVEDLHGVPIELVVTGDHQLDGAGHALVQALSEALLNAVRHGAPPVSAYVEAGGTRVEAFVRDHGAGFELDDVPADRLGVRESILGRMQRHGGSARLRRLENGTEVSLLLPVRSPPQQPAPPATAENPSNPHRGATP